ncbi:hypothetical protein ACET3X_009975 [Alternaria dauci]|uniref:Uncharacterized protein n=1 Tax=Alternaria dauci TaxID=48095 RepID=A0ABR3U8L8_9PLEO
MYPFQLQDEAVNTIEPMGFEQLAALVASQTVLTSTNIEPYIYVCARIFDHFGAVVFLEEGLERAEQWVTMTSISNEDHTRRAEIMNLLSAKLHQRRYLLEDVSLLNGDPPDLATHEDRQREAHSLIVKSTKLLREFQSKGRNEDLEQAILDGRRSISMTPISHQYLHSTISNVAVMYGRRFEKHGDPADIDQAVKMADLALMVLPAAEHDFRLARLVNLGSWLGRRFIARSEAQDLTRAINVTEEALGLASENSQKASISANLGNLLQDRYDRYGMVDDFNRAVDMAENAVNAMRDAESKDFTLQDIQVGLMLRVKNRYRTFGISKDLDRAIELGEEILTNTPIEHMRYNTRLSELSSIYSLRYEKRKNRGDLRRAIELHERTADLSTFTDHPYTIKYKAHSADLLSLRFLDLEGPSDRNDIDQAILLAEEVTTMIHEKNSEYRNALINLATIRAIRHEKYKKADDMNRAIEQSRGSEAHTVLEQAVRNLSLVSPRFLNNTDKQDQLGEFEGLASMAATAALEAGKTPCQALELLEMGRGVISGLLMDTRTDISNLNISDEKLCKEFEFYKDLLDPPIDPRSVNSMKHVHEALSQDRLRQHQMDSERLDAIIAKIRSIPGQERFLLPPSASEIMAAAANGPITVININEYRCDAFIVEAHQIRLVALRSLSKGQIRTRFLNQGLKRTSLEDLKWLWDVAARPVLDALGYKEAVERDTWPRIW